MDGDREEDPARGADPARGDDLARKDAQWAARADEFEQQGRVAGGAPLGGPTPPGTSTSSGPGTPTYTTPKHLRTSSGPRFSGRGVLAVFGILGVLLTVGIMAVLAVKVLDGVSGDGVYGDGVSGDGGDAALRSDTTVPTDAPTSRDGTGSAQIEPDRATDAARAAECEAERSTIETAAAAFEIMEGLPPTSVTEIVSAGILVPEEDGWSHELSADGTVVGTGACAPA